ncbi:ABC transporter substrate-binding protein [Moheibacter sediminis]|uniref:Peptide/nickel transport system substrate-binding protein n=1 Tax=Moheibacter sediminis TaxID=1434700 RepID=A0A1W1Z5R0_9FLAO|nr:ABC transporter substrate-binding protein [Moheibacter sediminis]SMC43789.1 peptide/nickel transport system substrate-binding protein [Moheibacter sediminis]
MKRTIQVLFLLLSLTTILFSCSERKTIDDSQIFRLNRYDNISSLDPTFARTQANNWVCNLMYNGLVKLNDSLQIVPDIAKKWEISEDGKTYTFTLRNDIYFHKNQSFGKDSTRTVNAEDFVYSFDRLSDTKVGGAGSWVLNNVDSYKAVNDSVFQMNLKEVFSPFLGLLSMKYCSVVPKEMFKNGQEQFRKTPIGTGPFQFQLWEDNVKLVLRKNPLYFEKDEKGNSLPYLEAVSMTFLPEKHSEFLELIQGNVDMMADLDPSYKNEILTPLGELNPKYNDILDLKKYDYLSTVYLCFYLDDGTPVDEKLRQAINYGIDKPKMVKYMMNGVATAAEGGFIPKGLQGYAEDIGYQFNPAKARELIQTYKKEKGSLPKITLTTVQEYVDVCEYMQAQLAKVGLNIEVNVVPGPTMRDGKATGKFSFFRANWGADYPDAENFLSLYYSKNFAPEGPNYSHYKNEKFDELYLKSFQINDEKQREKIYRQMDSLMMQSAPIVPLFYDQTSIFLRKNVKGFSMNPVKLLNLTRVYKTK